MPHPDRLALAVETGALVLPEAGPVLVLRAAPSPFLELIPPDRLRCQQSFRPLHDALAAQGHPVSVRAVGPAAAVVVNLTRSRAENLGNVARGLEALAAGGLLVVAGAKSDGVDSLARQVGKALPLEGSFVKAHGRVIWLRRPEALPEPVVAWTRDAGLARNADGFLTAPGMFSPEHADPGSRRLAAHLDGRLSGRVAELGAGWGGSRRRRWTPAPRSPRSTSTRRRRWRSKRPAPTSPTRACASIGPTRPASAPGCRPTTG